MKISKKSARETESMIRDLAAGPPPPDNQFCSQCGSATVVDGIKTGHESAHSTGKWRTKR